MTFHFAYGSNMSRALMQPRCPGAVPLGVARLDAYRFHIMPEGYASVAAQPGSAVHGVLWRLTPRDLAALNAYENIDSGLYRSVVLPVHGADGTVPAMIYVGHTRAHGKPRPGYMELVIEASREWNLPRDYIESLSRLSPSSWRGARPAEAGEL
jgi:gamma-glutamylcyclotransferase (GGCT)/AIG2-like uncharacterized protein YtfP